MAQSAGTPLRAETATMIADTPLATAANPKGQTKEGDFEALAPHSESENAVKDPNLVSWDGPADRTNPKNWTNKEKWVLTILVSFFTFVSPISSSMVSPALGSLGKELHMETQVEVEMALSIFVLGYAVGPLFFGPASEVFGRARVLMLSNLFYIAWNTGCGFAQNGPEMFVFRFLAGIGGSAPMSVGGGALSDVWAPEQRGKAVGIYSLAPLLGPVVGPVAGGFIAEHTTWRWVFWVTSITAAVIELAGFVWMRETHAPTILARKRKQLIKETGNTNLRVGDESTKDLASVMGGAMVRPLRMLTTQPIVQVIALYMGYLFGMVYLICVTFPVVWSQVYGESLGIGGLNFISLGIGNVLGAQINMHFVDLIYCRLKDRNNGVGLPEFRVPSMFVGSVLVPVGLFWYGWSVQTRLHWIMPNIGTLLFSAGFIVCLQSMTGYVIDSYTRFSASGLAAATLLRSLAGFIFPLFAPYLYDRLDYGWGSSVLAFISIAIGIPAPFVFYWYGHKLRAVSKYAAG